MLWSPMYYTMMTTSAAYYLAWACRNLWVRCYGLEWPSWSITMLTVCPTYFSYSIIDWVRWTRPRIPIKSLFGFGNSLFLPPFCSSILKPNLEIHKQLALWLALVGEINLNIGCECISENFVPEETVFLKTWEILEEACLVDESDLYSWRPFEYIS